METVLIQRDERFQPVGIWVFVNDLDTVREIMRDYGAYGDDDALDDFVETLEVMPMCDEAREALIAGGGRDGYMPECPEAWRA